MSVLVLRVSVCVCVQSNHSLLWENDERLVTIPQLCKWNCDLNMYYICIIWMFLFLQCTCVCKDYIPT
eukprot:jgi/Botrbrau1/8539/Bobra.0359s0004.1